MTGDAIQLVTEAIQSALEPVGKVYAGPLDDPDANDARLVLFLYRIATNADLRSAEHRVAAAASNQPPTVYRRSLPLDLYYLLTAPTAALNNDIDALGFLGQALQLLNDTPELVGDPVHGETVRLSLDPVSCEELSRIWTLFLTANFRTSVVYLASPVWIDPPQPETFGGPVVYERYAVGHLQASEVP